MPPGEMTTSRLAAFSGGVITIIVTNSSIHASFFIFL
jgi:hypothetical protein